MPTSPIGVFDSGVGGLTVVKAINDLLPLERVVYFGDTARVPYGSKSADTLRRFSAQIYRFLRRQGVKAVVVACNSASAAGIDHLREDGVPLLEVISPGTKAAARVSPGGSIGVVGTEHTVNSGAYCRSLRQVRPEAAVTQVACPLLVPLVEEAWFEHEATRLIMAEYLRGFAARPIDTLILGCTHYPLLKGGFAKMLPGVHIVDSAQVLAESLRDRLERAGRLNPGHAASHDEQADRYFVSDGSDKFRRIAELFIKRPVRDIEVVEL